MEGKKKDQFHYQLSSADIKSCCPTSAFQEILQQRAKNLNTCFYSVVQWKAARDGWPSLSTTADLFIKLPIKVPHLETCGPAKVSVIVQFPSLNLKRSTLCNVIVLQSLEQHGCTFMGMLYRGSSGWIKKSVCQLFHRNIMSDNKAMVHWWMFLPMLRQHESEL